MPAGLLNLLKQLQSQFSAGFHPLKCIWIGLDILWVLALGRGGHGGGVWGPLPGDHLYPHEVFSIFNPQISIDYPPFTPADKRLWVPWGFQKYDCVPLRLRLEGYGYALKRQRTLRRC